MKFKPAALIPALIGLVLLVADAAEAQYTAQSAGAAWRLGFLYFGSRQSYLDTGRSDAFAQGMRTADLLVMPGSRPALTE